MTREGARWRPPAFGCGSQGRCGPPRAAGAPPCLTRNKYKLRARAGVGAALGGPSAVDLAAARRPFASFVFCSLGQGRHRTVPRVWRPSHRLLCARSLLRGRRVCLWAQQGGAEAGPASPRSPRRPRPAPPLAARGQTYHFCT